MGKQTGVVQIEGQVGNLSFYKSNLGHQVRMKGGVSKNKIENDPAFQRTRENNLEFGRAGKAVKVLRNTLRALIQRSSDSNMTQRLVKLMMKVIHADEVNPRGLRNVIDGESEMLQGFEFNIQSKLGTTLYAPFTGTIDRVTGQLSVHVPVFNPGNMVAAPAGATHFRIVSAGAAIDFENETYVANVNATAELPWNGTPTAVIDLVNTVTANSTHPLFLALGIEFSQDVNGVKYSLNNGAFNALALVKVSGE
jgi:hypothetical protein